MAIRAKYTEQVVVLVTRETRARIRRLSEHLEESESEVIRRSLEDGGLDAQEGAESLEPITDKEVNKLAPERRDG